MKQNNLQPRPESPPEAENIVPFPVEAEPEQKPEKKRNRLTLLLTLLINIGIVGYIAGREFLGDAENVRMISLSDVRWVYVGLGVLCFVLAVYMEYVKYRRMILATEGRDDRRSAFECAVLGKYYDNVTPFGAGGQPFQILYLRRKGLSAGNSAAIPVAGFMMLQFAFVLIAAVVFVANRSVISIAPAIRYTAYLGLLMYAALPLGIIFFAFFPSGVRALVAKVTGFLGQIGILKDASMTANSLLNSLDEYVVSLKVMNKRPHFFLKLLLFSVLYQAAILSVPFFMLLAFGGSNDWWTVFSLVVYIYAAITLIPTPGNAGAAEGSFYAVFSSLEGGFLFWSMIAWRFIVYYLWLILGIIVVARSASAKPPKSKQAVPAEGRLRIALFTDRFLPSADPVAQAVGAYARELTAAGHEVCVVCPRQDGPTDDRFGYPVLRTPAVRFPLFKSVLPVPFVRGWITRYFRHQHFDLLHAHTPFAQGDIAYQLGRKLRIPVVASAHRDYFDDALRQSHSRFLANATANRVVDFYSKADRVWASSEAAAESLRVHGYHGEIRMMENGAEAAPVIAPEELKRLARETFRIPEGKRVLLYVGPLLWQKNLRMVLDVSRYLMDLRDDCLTVVVGSGYNSADIQKYAEKLGLGERIRFPGEVSSRELRFGLYLLSDLFFFPSTADSSPPALREAALAGLPALLVTDSPAAAPIREGENGYTAPENVARMTGRVQQILDDPERAQVGQRAKETLPVSWDDVVQRVTEAYRSELVPAARR